MYRRTRRKAYHPEVIYHGSTWKALNRLRTEAGRTTSNMKKWGVKENGKCECGGEQDADH